MFAKTRSIAYRWHVRTTSVWENAKAEHFAFACGERAFLIPTRVPQYGEFAFGTTDSASLIIELVDPRRG